MDRIIDLCCIVLVQTARNEMMAIDIDIFLDSLDKETENKKGFERGLFLLLRKHKEYLPELDDSFHTMLRKVDWIDSDTDMAIWQCLHESKVFWDCYEALKAQKIA